MEKKEITLLDLVKIALRWIWVLILGAVVCAGIAFFYSKEMVTPLYSVTSKFVIQTKDQSSSSDIFESQRTVAYAQLAVGTYIDILNTRDFSQEVAYYMNGNVKGQKMTKEAVNALICQGIIADGGIYDYKKDELGAEMVDENGDKVPSTLRTNITLLVQEGVLPEPIRDKEGRFVYNVVHSRLLKNNEKALADRGITNQSEQEEVMHERLSDKNFDDLLKDMVANGDFLEANIYSGDTDEKIARLDAILYRDFGGVAQYVEAKDAEGNNNGNFIFDKATNSYVAVEPGTGTHNRDRYRNEKNVNGAAYTAGSIRGIVGFSTPEENSTTFDIVVTGVDPDEAYTVAKIVEIIVGDYVEERYPGIGMISTIDSATETSAPINNNTVLLTLIGFIGGLLLAFVIVYIIELSDNRIKNEEELSEKTGLSVVGIIPDMLNDKANSGYYYYSYERREK